MNRSIAGLLLLSLLAGCARGGSKAGGGASGHVTVLRMASQFSGGQPLQLVRFAEEVNRRSGGSMRIEFEDDWRAGDPHQEPDTIADVRAGKVELAWVGARAWDWVGVRSFDALLAPLLIDSYALEQRVFERGIPQKMLAGVAQAGVVGIEVLPGPLRRLVGVRGPFVRPADFRGRTVGVQGLVSAETLRVLGARPRQLFSHPTLEGLDGIEEQLGAIQGNEHDRTAKYVSANLNLWPRPLVIFMGRKTFARLTSKQEDTLSAAAPAAMGEALSASREEDSGSARFLCSRGLRFIHYTPAQLAGVRRALAPVYARLEREPSTAGFIHEIQALKPRAPEEQPLRCAETTQTRANSAATPLDGAWEMKVTRAQLLARHASDEPQSEKGGDFRLVLEHGRLSLSNRVDNFSASGSYTVTGGTIVFRLPGEDLWPYRWSVYRGMLTLRKVRASASPPQVTAAPFHRVRR